MSLSIFQEWINSAIAFINKLWPGIQDEDEVVDISNVDAVKSRPEARQGPEQQNSKCAQEVHERYRGVARSITSKC